VLTERSDWAGTDLKKGSIHFERPVSLAPSATTAMLALV
jgi:hypothetical protein